MGQFEKIAKIPLYQFHNLSACDNITHFITTRQKDENAPLGMSLGGNQDREMVHQNRETLARAVGIAPHHIITANQVHGAHVKIVSQSTGGKDDADALVTDIPGLCVMVLTADCVPILLYDPVRKVAGAVHAGWKGTVRSIAAKAVQVFEDTFQSRPQDIIAGIGPSIGPCCFEVGPEVSQQFEEKLGRNHILPGKNGRKETIDLWGENARQLMAAGVPESHIEQADLCTCHHARTFFSYRCEGEKTGRFGTGIFLR